MANKLHDALRTLAPRDFNDVPLSDLSNFLTTTFTEASVIVDSVPQPSGGSPSPPKPQCSKPNTATKSSEILSSTARAHTSPEFEELADKWGKPLKIGAKDNPLNVSVWKMAGHDRNGAWFARRSVHEGLGFAKWKKAMMREFPESLETDGKPGEGSVRGIGADRLVERKAVWGVGKMEVYQLAAQFPAPTAPREFITMLLTTDKKFDEPSTPGRQYTVVSIPVNHPDAPPRSGLVRGKYESVEVIREIPLNSSKHSKSTSDLAGSSGSHHSGRDRGHTISGDKAENDEDDEAELNPVEWIMITRSDPGGGIPRFLVDRGTPASITADAAKFMDWACSKEHFPQEDHPDAGPDTTSKSGIDESGAPALPPRPAEGGVAIGGSSAGHDRTDSANDPHKSLTEGYEGHPPPQGGMLSGLISAYAPNVVQQYLHPDSPSQATAGGAYGNGDESDTTETSSVSSFASAEEFNTAEEGPSDATGAMATPSGIGIHAPGSETSLTPSEMNGKPTHQDKELAKLAEKKAKLDEKLSRAKEKDEAAKIKAQQKYEKDLAKLEAKREKEKRKLDARRKKQADKDAVSAVQRERDEWRQHAQMIQKENQLLREQVAQLQKENTLMAARVGKLEEGKTVLAGVKEDLRRDRARSVGSVSSGKSGRRSRQHTLSEE